VNSVRTTVCLLLALSGGAVRAESYAWHAAEARGDEKAVLVLCPGMNQDGAFFLRESPWMDFADAHDLGVVVIAFESDAEKMYGDAREGYYWPEQGSGEALLEAVRETYGEDLPILVYGFSGGAHFASRFAEWAPGRVTAWAAYSAQFWDSPGRNDADPPGIVACGEHDGARWHPSFSYFYEGRDLSKPWIWVSLPETGHVRHGAFERFVRGFFADVLAGGGSRVFVDIGTGVEHPGEGAALQPELLAVLPSGELLAAWRELHAP